ncbi:MAG TPA: alanine--tRNA ligase [Patescibacteria group bacterium]
MTHQDIRKKFIDYLISHGHVELPAASLVPDNDPTVLFTVAGMQQFKQLYEHPDQAPSKRVVTIQPCIRTIDIDEVGDDTHSTVFEMMGWFSFGYTGSEDTLHGEDPYFKNTAIKMGWEFLTKELGVDPNRIRATYFGGDAKRPADVESKEILESLEGLSLIEATGENFWGPVGEEGPCGPNAEFYIDDTEVLNNVFNQYIRDTEGNYTQAEYRGVDMGTGFERLVAAIQGVPNIYETDLVKPFLQCVRAKSYNYNERHGRIIVDHVKAALYLLADGVKPGNKGRDYVLRRLIRRSVRAAQIVGFQEFEALLNMLADEYGTTRDAIAKNRDGAIALFLSERDKFLKTLQDGTSQLKKLIGNERGGEITGEQAFKLFDTYGFPIELTQEMAEELGWTVDADGFTDELNKHRELSKQGSEKIFKGGLADHDPQTIAHHTAHHLLLAALREVLGDHVVQRGSNVTSERLRIDVAHPEKITDDQIKTAEDIVNQKISEDLPVISEIMDRDEAFKLGALAEFGAKYPDKACVYSIIDQDGEVFSREFCGGPHVMFTGELGHFEIIKEEASGAGIRRIRARVVPRT